MQIKNIFYFFIFIVCLNATDAKSTTRSLDELVNSCSPNINQRIIQALIKIESEYNPYAININGGYSLAKIPTTLQEAKVTINWLKQNNFNYDVGLTQINSNNFFYLNKKGEDLLDPCLNLEASSNILTNCYEKAIKNAYVNDDAILHAISCYNTGDLQKGIKNGYVEKFKKAYSKEQLKKIYIPALTKVTSIVSQQNNVVEQKLDVQQTSKDIFAVSNDIFHLDHGDIFNAK